MGQLERIRFTNYRWRKGGRGIDARKGVETIFARLGKKKKVKTDAAKSRDQADVKRYTNCRRSRTVGGRTSVC